MRTFASSFQPLISDADFRSDIIALFRRLRQSWLTAYPNQCDCYDIMFKNRSIPIDQITAWIISLSQNADELKDGRAYVFPCVWKRKKNMRHFTILTCFSSRVVDLSIILTREKREITSISSKIFGLPFGRIIELLMYLVMAMYTERIAQFSLFYVIIIMTRIIEITINIKAAKPHPRSNDIQYHSINIKNKTLFQNPNCKNSQNQISKSSSQNKPIRKNHPNNITNEDRPPEFPISTPFPSPLAETFPFPSHHPHVRGEGEGIKYTASCTCYFSSKTWSFAWANR